MIIWGFIMPLHYTKKNDEYLVKLIAAAQLKLGLKPDGQIGGATTDAYANWWLKDKIDEYHSQYEQDGKRERIWEKISPFCNGKSPN